MHPHEIVVCKVQGSRRLQVLHFLTERIGQPGKPPHGHPHRQVLALNQTRRNVGHGRVPGHRHTVRGDHLGGAVAAGLHDLRFIGFYNLPVIHVHAKGHVHGIHVGRERIRRELHPVGQPTCKIPHKGGRHGCGARPHAVRRDEFGVGIQRHKSPHVAGAVRIICGLHALLLLADVGPDFIHLEPTVASSPAKCI